MITVEYYGILKGILGTREESYPHRPTMGELVDSVAERHPEIAGALPGTAMACNEELVHRDAALPEGCTVALLPPVSGG